MRITANQVTFSRLVAMPFLAALLYGGFRERLVALVIGTFVGLTDYLDGWLARRQGPTVLGGLMDPIADKVFLALVVLPFGETGLMPWWAVVALLEREFLVTALRSSFELRQRHLRSTYFAKVKTWVQMFGVGYLMIVALDPPAWVLRDLLLVGPAGGALLGGLLYLLVRRRVWRGAVIFGAAFVFAAAVFVAFGETTFRQGVIIAVVAITWASGLDYVVIGVRELPGDLHWFDFVRLVGAAAVPALGCLCLARLGTSPQILALISIELGHGGLDNLLAHHTARARPAASPRLGTLAPGSFPEPADVASSRPPACARQGAAAAPARRWGGRVLTVSALLAAALVAAPMIFVSAALAVSAVATTVAFYRSRSFYLGFVDFGPPRAT